MRLHIAPVISAVCSLFTLSVWAADVGKPDSVSGPYQPAWESLKAHQDPEWFRDAKFGIYTHWGPVTVGSEDCPAGGQWYGHEMYDPRSRVFAFHQAAIRRSDQGWLQGHHSRSSRRRSSTPRPGPICSPAPGAKFAGPVAVHHDNFAMWDSAVTPWNAVKMGPHRDVTGELEKAIKRHGLKFITTFHHGFAWRYFEPAFAFDGADPAIRAALHRGPQARRAALEGVSRSMAGDGQRGGGQISARHDLVRLRAHGGDHARVPAADVRRLLQLGRREPPRVGRGAQIPRDPAVHGHPRLRARPRGSPGAVSLADRYRPGRLVQQQGHAVSIVGHHDRRLLVDIVSKNGCMLLDVSPAADGTIPDQARQILLGMGDWLKINGEAIYGTRPWIIYGEGPTRGKGGGFSEQHDRSFTARDIRFTTKGDSALRHRAWDGPRTENC